VPTLILFPGNAILASDSKQTEEFFTSAWGRYEGVKTMDMRATIMASVNDSEAPGSVWADVTWSYNGQSQERFCYQLVDGQSGYQIGVLTPMA